MLARAMVVIASFLGGSHSVGAADDLKPHVCGPCAEWNQPQAPFKVFGNTSYVGVRGLGTVIVSTPKGLIVIDAGLPQSVPLIVENLKTLGHSVRDVKWIAVSHAHYDHGGGVAALARLSGAQVAASPHAAGVLRAGMVGNDDPQVGFGEEMRFPRVSRVKELKDGEAIRLGGVAVFARHTPGHTPGGVTWTWKSCEGKRCLDVVYADSLNAVSAPGFRFHGDEARLAVFRRTFDRVAALPCDILLAAHPNNARLFERLAGRASNPDALVDTGACKRYVDEARARLDKRLGEEASAGSKP